MPGDWPATFTHVVYILPVFGLQTAFLLQSGCSHSELARRFIDRQKPFARCHHDIVSLPFFSIERFVEFRGAYGPNANQLPELIVQCAHSLRRPFF
jgi:hypothetical protein